jgi:hypothetical protein
MAEIEAWTSRPLTLLLPALSAPATPEERERTVHLRVDGAASGTWLYAAGLRKHIEDCRLALAELDERERAVRQALPLTDPAVDEDKIAAQWAAEATKQGKDGGSGA